MRKRPCEGFEKASFFRTAFVLSTSTSTATNRNFKQLTTSATDVHRYSLRSTSYVITRPLYRRMNASYWMAQDIASARANTCRGDEPGHDQISNAASDRRLRYQSCSVYPSRNTTCWAIPPTLKLRHIYCGGSKV